MHQLSNLLDSNEGATAIEYALIASLISIAAIIAMNALGANLLEMYNNIAAAI